MIMIAQINFSELPKLNGYPNTGILQLFINGMDYNDIGDDQKAIYHEHPATEEEDMLNDIPRTSFDISTDDFPFEGMYRILSGRLEKICMQQECDGFDEIMNPIIEKYLGVKVKSMWQLPMDVYRQLNAGIKKNAWGTRIGGHPNFTQWDPRKNNNYYDTLLVQIDSEKGIMWGDVGIGNWFINGNDLRNKNFNKVLFNWDCC